MCSQFLHLIDPRGAISLYMSCQHCLQEATLIFYDDMVFPVQHVGHQLSLPLRCQMQEGGYSP